MDFRVETLAPCRKKVTVTVPADRVREALDGQFQEINKQVALPGFRPGKAPRKLLEARFGAHVRDEVKGKLVEAAIQKAVEDRQVVPLGQPTLDVKDLAVDPEKPFEFQFEVTTRPEFELPAWKGLEVRVPAPHVSEPDVDAAVERLRLSEGTLEASEAPLAADDVAVVDWKAVADGRTLHAESGAYYRLGRNVLDGIVVEGLDAGLLGRGRGATATVRGRAAPDDPRAPLAGAEFDVTVEVLEAKRFRPADLDEAFLKRHDFDDVAEMRKDVRRRLLRARERERDRLAEERLVDSLVASTSMALPPELVEQAVEGWVERRRIEGGAEGRSEDDIAKDIAAGRDETRSKVEADLKRHFVLDRICEAESLEVSEQELLGAVEQMARETGTSTGELVQHFQEAPGRLAELRSHLKHGKARDALRRAAVVVEEAPPAAAK